MAGRGASLEALTGLLSWRILPVCRSKSVAKKGSTGAVVPKRLGRRARDQGIHKENPASRTLRLYVSGSVAPGRLRIACLAAPGVNPCRWASAVTASIMSPTFAACSENTSFACAFSFSPASPNISSSTARCGNAAARLAPTARPSAPRMSG